MPRVQEEDRIRAINWICACEWCGSSFGSHRSDARYCSKNCQSHPRNRAPAVVRPRPSNEDLAWAAGFFDGEGCFTARLSGGRRYLNLQISQKQPTELLEKFTDIFGIGRTYFWTRPDRVGEFTSYLAHGRNAFLIADLMWPWLGERKRADFKRVLRAVGESPRSRRAQEWRERFVYAKKAS